METHKVLRSLIQEFFPLELRVKIDLLSRRRDILNKEKQEELFKLLREFNIEGVVPLGSGTNRYAFRFNGYAIKVATDVDGKIDNKKEFLMSPRLQPYVTKTYEISENGCLLVSEYIQPFSSYAEMMAHQDEIINILNKLSLRYLIGDVGINSKNYANWGLRIGSDDPVCLDFAYVFEVSSEIFVCQECNTNSMLVPTKDFTGLYCPNPKCAKRYSFEEIRMRISNEEHLKEIGDLSDVGYVLSESNVDTALNVERSKYLKIEKPQKKIKKPVTEDVDVVDNFIFNKKEDVQMSRENEEALVDRFSENGLVIQAKVVTPDETDDEDLGSVVYVGAVEADEPKEEEPVFELNDEDESIPEVEVIQYPAGYEEATTGKDDVDEVPVEAAKEDDMEAVTENEVETIVQTANDEVSEDYVKQMNADDWGPLVNDFHANFLFMISKAISRLSNKIGEDLHQRDVFNEVRPFIRKKKEFGEAFYTAAQNAVFRSLVSFCGMNETELPNDKSNGYHRDWVLEGDLPPEAYATLKFIEKFWYARHLQKIENGVAFMQQFAKEYGVDCKIAPEWKQAFIDRFTAKYPIDPTGAKKVADKIGIIWCNPEDEDKYGYDEEDDPTDDEPVECGPEIAFTEPMDTNDDDESDDESPSLRVEVFPNDEMLHIVSCDQYGKIVIPIYEGLEAANDMNTVWLGDQQRRNGNNEWIAHMIPDMMFKTNDPIRWINQYNKTYSPMRAIILSEEDESGTCIMGMYNFDGVFMYNDETEEMDETDDSMILDLVNRLITNAIANNSISFIDRAMMNSEMIHDEADILALEQEAWANASDMVPPTDAEKAAVEAMMNQTETQEESVDDQPLSPAEKAVLDALGLNDEPEDTPVEELNHEVNDEEQKVVFTPIRRQTEE